jgi:hypothetical protein
MADPFPEIVAALGQLPDGMALDGELGKLCTTS